MAAKKKIKKVTKKAPAKKAAIQKAPAKKAVAKKMAAPAKKAPAPKATKKSSTDYTMMLTPLDDRLLVALEEMPKTTPGGLYIPDTATGLPVRGTVVAKGRGRRNKKGQLRPLDVNVGDQVMFAEYSGTKITLGNGDVLILREEDVLGIVTHLR
jgi:chaperonin GroES